MGLKRSSVGIWEWEQTSSTHHYETGTVRLCKGLLFDSLGGLFGWLRFARAQHAHNLLAEAGFA